MPTYDYICSACGHELEIFQSMSEGPKRKCPACGKLKLQRQIGAGAGIIFKGQGYYQTDYRSQGYKDAAAKDKDSSGPSSGSDSGSSSSTPPAPGASGADAPKSTSSGAKSETKSETKSEGKSEGKSKPKAPKD